MQMLTLLGVFIFSISALAMNGRTTYQAKIVKPDGYPLEASSVNFRFTVLDTVGSCVLYVEDYSAVNMSGGGGLISFALGNGNRSFPVSGTSLTFQNTFDNSVPMFNCQTPGTYNPGPNDTRKIVMQFNDGGGWQTLPAMTINAVPYAMYANKSNDSKTLNGKADTAFVENSTLAALNCNPATHAITFNGVSFSCIPVGSSSSGITSVTTSGTVLVTGGTASAPVISIKAVTMSQDGYLTSLDYAEFKAKLAASSTQIINTLGYAPVSGAAVATQINNSNLSGDVSGTISSNSVVSVGGKTASQISTSVNDTLAATSSATADTIVKRNSSGNATFNDVYANAAKINYVDIYKPGTSFNIRLQAPTSLSTNYVLNLPTTSGTTGQVLSTDGSGNLSWINPSTGSVVSVSATAPLASTGGSNPTISITQATSSTNGYLSSTDWNTFNNKQAATSAAIIATLGYTPADNAASGTYAQKANNLSDLTNIATARTNLGLGTFATANTLDLSSVSATGIIADARLQTQSNVTSGTQYTKVTVDGKGRVTSGAQLSSSDVTTALGYTPANDSASGTYLVKASNLSDLTNIPQARTNLGLGGFATVSSLDLGTTSATGTLAVGRLPSFIGDATIAAASNTIVLSNSGVTAGTYTKVTVDSKGRVTSSSALSSSDVTTALGYTPANSTSGVTLLNGSASQTQTFASSNVGTAFGISTSNGVHTFAIPLAASSSVTAGLLSNADYTTFTNKQNATSSAIIATLGYTPANATSATQWTTSGSNIYYNTGNIGVGIVNPSAKLELAAGTASVAPLRLTSGTLLSSAQSGTMEYDGFNFYLTDSTNTRRTIATGSSAGTIDNASNINSSGNITMTPVGSVIVSSTTASTNSNTGALVVKGGLGVAGNINTAGNLNVSGSSVIDGSFKLSSMTSGSVLFAGANGTVTQDNSSLYWDGANKRLGIGSNSPAQTLSVSGTSYFSGNVGIGSVTNPNTSRLQLYSNGAVNDKILEVTGAGIAGGQSGPFYGIYVDTPSNNNATARYGVYAYGNGGGGGSNYGVYGTTTQGSSTRLTVGVAGQAIVNSAAVNNAPTMTTPVAGVMATASSTGTSMNATTTALLARNETVYGAMSYGAYIDAVSGPTTVVPLRVDFNTSELMRISSSGNVGVGTTSPNEKLVVSGGNIVASGLYASGPVLVNPTAGAHMIWYPRKAAFRVGNLTGTAWNETNIGNHSLGIGTDSNAPSLRAIAIGHATTATGGNDPVAIGTSAYANNGGAAAIGMLSRANGAQSLALGTYSTSEVFQETVIGPYNVLSVGNAAAWVNTDPLFVVANGLSTGARSNAMTILKNANVGIGLVSPSAKLHLSTGTSSTAPLKFTSGTLLTSAQSGTMEYDGFNFYLTDSTNTRRTIATGSGAGTIDNANNINSSGNITMTPVGSVIVSSTTASTNSSTGALVVKGGLGVAGNINTSGDINVSGSQVIDGPLKLSSMTSGSVLFADNNGVVAQDNNNFYWDNANKRLGIGSNSPSPNAKLKVSETSTSTTSAQAAFSISQILNPSGVNSLDVWSENHTIEYTSNFNGNRIISSHNVARTGSSSLANLNAAIGVVGAADHAGTGTMSDNMGVYGRVQNSSTGIVTVAKGLYSVIANSGTGSIGTGYGLYIDNIQATNKFSVYANDSTAPSYFAGNVGIGTTAPSALLHISSSSQATERIRLSGQEFYQAGNTDTNGVSLLLGVNRSGNRQLWLADSANLAQNSTNSVLRLSTYGDISALATDGVTTKSLSLNANGGNVGIGITTPGSKLDVKGDNVNNTFRTTDTSGQFRARIDQFYDFYMTSASGTDTIVIKNSGNVGIGTNSPTGKFQVAGSHANGIMTDTNDRPSVGVTGGYPQMVLMAGGTTNTSHGSTIMLGSYDTGTSGNHKHWSIGTAGQGSTFLDIGYHAGTDINPHAGIRNYNGSTFMTILNSGNVGIGTTAPSYTLHVVGTAGLSTGTAWTNASDIRLKDIQGDYEYGLSEVLKLHTVRYNYKKGNALGLPSDFSKTGFIAQEVQKVIPDAVNVRKDGYLELNVDPIHWAVVNAVKELYKLVVEIKNEILGEVRGLASIVESKADKAEIENLRKDNVELKQKAAEVDVLKAENAELKTKAKEFDALKAYLCSKDPAAPICK